jgi:hypothetical protein
MVNTHTLSIFRSFKSIWWSQYVRHGIAIFSGLQYVFLFGTTAHAEPAASSKSKSRPRQTHQLSEVIDRDSGYIVKLDNTKQKFFVNCTVSADCAMVDRLQSRLDPQHAEQKAINVPPSVCSPIKTTFVSAVMLAMKAKQFDAGLRDTLLHSERARTKNFIGPERRPGGDARTTIARINRNANSRLPRRGFKLVDYEMWATEPLAKPEKTLESGKLEIYPNYKEQLEQVFKTILSLNNSLNLVSGYGYGNRAGPVDPRGTTVVYVEPDFSVEPLPTYYLRSSIAYESTRNSLTSLLGQSTLRRLHRVTANGRSSLCLDDELQQMQDIFLGAYCVSMRELGLQSKQATFKGRRISPGCIEKFQQWSKVSPQDSDVTADARVLLPISYDKHSGLTKVWAFLGWTSNPIIIGYAKEPEVISIRKAGDPSALRTNSESVNKVKVRFRKSAFCSYLPVVVEMNFAGVLNQDEFRHLCDENNSVRGVIEELTPKAPPGN